MQSRQDANHFVTFRLEGEEGLYGKLICPAPHKLHPEVEVAERKNLEWAIQMGFAGDAKSRGKIEGAKFAAMMAGVLRDEPLDNLILAANLVTAFVMLDDLYEKHESKFNKNDLQEMFKIFSTIFASRFESWMNISSDIKFPQYMNLCKAFIDIHTRLMDLGVATRFLARSVNRYFDGLELMSSRRAQHEPMTEQTYLNMREQTFGQNVVFELIAAMKNVILSEQIRHGLKFEMMTRKALQVALALNDLISLPNDLKDESKENFVLIKMDGDTAKAFQKVTEFYNAEMQELLNMGKWVNMDEKLRSYYDAVIMLMTRNIIDWHFTYTKRYGKIAYTFSTENSPLVTMGMYAKTAPVQIPAPIRSHSGDAPGIK